MKKQEVHIFKGMQQDLDVARQSADFLRDAHNIRFVQEDGSNLLVISNEKSTKRLTTNKVINGTYVGHCAINNWLVVFTTVEEEGERVDRIYVLTFQGGTTFNVKVLFEGSLGFSEDTFVSAVGIYETSSVVKVYWVDGEHEVRMANIMMEEEFYTNPNQFSFVPTLKLNETITVTTNRDGGGLFPAGTVQYAFAYFNKNSAQSKIFYTTPLHYVIGEARGLSPEAKGSCSFTINITDADDFDYVRIYAIQRTSINAVPAVRYIDRPIEVTTEGGTTTRSLTYTDFNLEGSSMDPQELLYVGGSQLVSNVISIKDNTLFLGGYIDVKDRELDKSKLKKYTLGEGDSLTSDTRDILDRAQSDSYYQTILPTSDDAAGFKHGEIYHFGIQIQDSSGEWSVPIPVYDGDSNNFEEENKPMIMVDGAAEIPSFDLLITRNNLETYLTGSNYNNAKRIRPVMITPSWATRKKLAQCVLCPSIRDSEGQYQSSWFFRPIVRETTTQQGQQVTEWDPSETDKKTGGYWADWVGPIPSDESANRLDDDFDWNPAEGSIIENRHNVRIPYPYDIPDDTSFSNYVSDVPINAEVPFNIDYFIDWGVVTLHSPEFEFNNDVFSNLDLTGTTLECVGVVSPISNQGELDVQTSTVAIDTSVINGGFSYSYYNQPITSAPKEAAKSLIFGPFYRDAFVDDYNYPDNGRKSSIPSDSFLYNYPWKFYVYPWHSSRSLNNDDNRGGRSAALKTKRLYNFKTYDTSYGLIPKKSGSEFLPSFKTVFVNLQDQGLSYIGDSGKIYKNTVDSLIPPPPAYNGMYPLYARFNYCYSSVNVARGSSIVYANRSFGPDYGILESTFLKYGSESIRMKYKSTPHLVAALNVQGNDSARDYIPTYSASTAYAYLPVVDLERLVVPEISLENQLWIPVGEPKNIEGENDIRLKINYGDTWYARYDCLKTYPFNINDENCIVEIGSFMLETRVNLDGRYDGNIGKGSLVTTPQIFNLLNPVYSQEDNFFTYRMQDPLYETVASHPNTVLWSREKQLGEVVDTFASITPASSYDLDGKLGEITALFNQQDYLYAFQEYGLSHLLFNSRVQIPVSDGAPVEITNSKKMEGFRVISDTHGLFDKQSLAKSPAGTYFINSTDGDLFIFSDNRITNIGSQKGMGSWIKSMLDTSETNSTNTSTSNTSGGGSTGGDSDITRPNPRPRLPRKRRQTKGSDTFTRTLLKLLYDKNTGDLYVDTGNEFLDFQESIGQFTSFLDYKDVNALASFTDNSIILAPSAGEVGLYKMFSDSFTDTEGYYNRLLETNVVPSLEFISNSEPLADKIFTNLDARADFYNKDDDVGDVLDHNAFFNSIRVWNEYQDTGDVPLTHLVNPQGTPKVLYSNTKKKFRTWRLDIPRAFDFDNNKRLLDRIRNHWTHIKLTMALDSTHKRHFNLHDIGVTYYV